MTIQWQLDIFVKTVLQWKNQTYASTLTSNYVSLYLFLVYNMKISSLNLWYLLRYINIIVTLFYYIIIKNPRIKIQYFLNSSTNDYFSLLWVSLYFTVKSLSSPNSVEKDDKERNLSIYLQSNIPTEKYGEWKHPKPTFRCRFMDKKMSQALNFIYII